MDVHEGNASMDREAREAKKLAEKSLQTEKAAIREADPVFSFSRQNLRAFFL